MTTKKKTKSSKVSEKTTEKMLEPEITIRQYVKARNLPVYMIGILENYIVNNEGAGFPKTVLKTADEWMEIYLTMNREKA